MYRSAVLMSTYNGERYLKEQIDSILAQEGVDTTLYIRDDESSDRTLQIIKEYKEKFPEKIHFIKGRNKGPGRSFMDLVYKVPDDYDYYAYSDQDDIWMTDKLEAGIRILNESQKELYMGNLMCVDKDLNEIGLRNTEPADITPYGIMVMNKTNGCTMIFTRDFCSVLKDPQKRPCDELLMARCHDAWTAMVGAVMDVIVYDFDYHMLYRQHENNVIGATDYNGIGKVAKMKISKLKNRSKRNGRSWIAKEIIRTFPEESARYPYLELYAGAGNIKNKIKLISSYKEYRRHGAQSFPAFTAYVLFGLI